MSGSEPRDLVEEDVGAVRRPPGSDCRTLIAGQSVRGDLSIEVFDDLVGLGPLSMRDDEVDVAAAEPVKRMVRNAAGINTHGSELVTPSHRRVLFLERADGLPSSEPRIGNRYSRLL